MAPTNTYSSKSTTAGDAAVGAFPRAGRRAGHGGLYRVGWSAARHWPGDDLDTAGRCAGKPGVRFVGASGRQWGLWRDLGADLVADPPQAPQLPAWLGGLVYGLLLLVIAQAAVAALNPLLMDIGLAHRAVAHLVYGLVLGLLTARSQASQN